MKKGQLGWESIHTWILVLVFLVVILLIVFMNKERMADFMNDLKIFFRFGGA